jgi:phosphate/sulfate permease
MQVALWEVVVLVAQALLFDFMNGFHDAANSIATVVSTGVLKPTRAVAFAAFFNVVAIFVFHLNAQCPCGTLGPAGHIVMAWTLTIPATVFIAAVFYGIGRFLF